MLPESFTLGSSDLNGPLERKAICGFKLGGNPLPQDIFAAFLLQNTVKAALEVKFFSAFDEAVFAFTCFFELCNEHRCIDIGIRKRLNLPAEVSIFSPNRIQLRLEISVVPLL
jgi:hypothetical protein